MEPLLDHEQRLRSLEKRFADLETRNRSPRWGTWTPTMTQGVALTVSVLYARYSVIGKTLIAQARLTVGSAGTAGQGITVGGLPIARTNSYGVNSGIVGTYHYYTGTQYFVGAQVDGAATNIVGISDAAGVFGTSPAITAASGHACIVFVVYEID